ncbi:MAG TPA: GspE/PulE family protein [Patescibacteria group bacterium]
MADIDKAIYQFRRSDEESYTKAQAKHYHVPYVNLVGYPILPHTLSLISVRDIESYKAVPFIRVGNKLRIAITTPTPETITFLQSIANQTGLEVSIALASPSSINFGLHLAQLEDQKIAQAQHVAVSESQQKQALRAIGSRQELEKKLAQASATQVLDLLFAAATGMEASDIHIEPQEHEVRVRYRIDGVLQEITNLTEASYHQILSRVKYLAHMKFDIKNVNQDGRFTIELAETTLDVRVSTLPSAYGQIIDMRLLKAHAEFIKLDQLGLSPNSLSLIKEAIALPHGMILVTGPTGSGKTTTLYAILDSLNQSGVKIITLEDPIEYRVAGIDQVQVENDKGFTFAEALKGVLRQDPDIVMVGEIRDQETADIGLQAAMTGHLFLSTLHTNNAPAALSRFVDMGIEPYKIAGAINLIIAQRLVRKRCANCQGEGCEACNQTGYKGRIPILEVLKPSKALDDAIVRKAAVRELYEIAQKEGMVSLHDDGMEKVKQGLTTEEEVNRVTAEFNQE